MGESEQISSSKLSELVAAGMMEKKAENIVVLDLRGISAAIADFFVIGSGTSDRHVESIADAVDEFVFKQTGSSPWHTEGNQNKEWILLDFVDVVAHVFKSETRQHFNLERLWGDAKAEVFSNKIEQ
jgi:ribosome-associated protein